MVNRSLVFNFVLFIYFLLNYSRLFCSVDSIPKFQEMYSFDQVELLEYEFLVVGLQDYFIRDTTRWGRKQFEILSAEVNSDSAFVEYNLNEFSFLDNSTVETAGHLVIYNSEYVGLPELSNICENQNAHFGCNSNLMEVFELSACRLNNGASVDSDGRFGRVSKRGDGDLAYSLEITEGLGYSYFSLTGSSNTFIQETLTGFVENGDTIGTVSDFNLLASNNLDTNQPIDITIFPNPAFNEVNLIVKGLSEYTLSLYNIDGILLAKYENMETRLDLNFIDSSGIYYIIISDLQATKLKVLPLFITR